MAKRLIHDDISNYFLTSTTFCRSLFRIPAAGLFHHTAGKGHERLSRLAPVVQDFGRTVVTVLANALHDGICPTKAHASLRQGASPLLSRTGSICFAAIRQE